MFQWKDREFLAAIETAGTLEKRIGSTSRTRLVATLFGALWGVVLFWNLFEWLRIRGTPVEKLVGIPPSLPLCIIASLSLFGVAAVAHAELRALFVLRKLREERGSS